MNKEEVLQIINEQPKWYQKIQLPFGLETPGRDRSQTANCIFPTDLKGASVLDIGCAEGFFCFEAKRRNAGRVVGLDLDRDRQRTATKLAGVLGFDIEFLQGSVMDIENLGMFDYVLCLNILHHLTDPIGIIHKLINITREKLVLEVADISMGIADIGRKRKSKAVLGWWGPLFKLLPIELRPGILAVDSRGRFLITRNWIKNLFQNQYCDIERIEFSDSELQHRYLALASIRSIEALRFISGPTNVGKSEFVARLKSGDPEVSQLIGLNLKDGWRVMTASKLQSRPDGEVKKLVLEYDICRTILRRYGYYQYDPALTIKRVADEKTVYVLVCPVDSLVVRVREVLNSYQNPKGKHVRKAERMIFEYSQPGRLRKLYESWISYCKANGFELRYIDVSSRNVKSVTEKEALMLVS
ncbi:MAG: methyltransferase domain-containing protein [Deltaproteobacteria bacterium]|nr:methyltransferase domain-containing protein [Deltaproteobacteria bacterium]